ncbi:MAG: hypothetical protein DLM59_02850 [Pseudonocardiales bacterium]|nr:MAG: hypothetical protein DLM59_02850 [Pseudonocardiales bacterium]
MTDYDDNYRGGPTWPPGSASTGVAEPTTPPVRPTPAWSDPRRWLLVAVPLAVLLLVGGFVLFWPHAKPAPSSPPPPPSGKPTVPTGATLFGPSIARPSDLTRWGSTATDPLPVARVFISGALPAAWGDDPVLASTSARTTVVLSFKTGTPEALGAFLKSRPAGQKVYVSYYHEPEDQIAKGTFTAEQYRATWQRYSPVIRAAGGIPTLILQQYTTQAASGRNWRDYYPGDAVDVVAWDAYNPARKTKKPGYTDYEKKIIPRIEKIATAIGKPWGLAEFGSPIVGTDAERVAWAKAVRRSVAQHGALWACWWDVKSPGFDDTASSPVRAAWRAP